jgi:hypothetical protein
MMPCSTFWRKRVKVGDAVELNLTGVNSAIEGIVTSLLPREEATPRTGTMTNRNYAFWIGFIIRRSWHRSAEPLDPCPFVQLLAIVQHIV